ncbi:MAG TPA: hypothetical protein VKR58_13295 [Aquella sp.]|nr:hypothetical protein [Aquella sp.]
MKKLLLIPITLSVFLTGCASMFSSETQTVKIGSTTNNQVDPNILCTIQNGRGSWTANLGESTDIRRDSRPLRIKCYNKNNTLVGSTSVPSNYNTTNLWNIPLTLIPAAGVAGWVLDGTNGTANEYPHTISVNTNNITQH